MMAPERKLAYTPDKPVIERIVTTVAERLNLSVNGEFSCPFKLSGKSRALKLCTKETTCCNGNKIPEPSALMKIQVRCLTVVDSWAWA